MAFRFVSTFLTDARQKRDLCSTGFFQQQYTPYRRGFDHFFGYLGSHIDYWTYSYGNYSTYPLGYDLRHNLDVDRSYNGTYATGMFTAEAVKVIEGGKSLNLLYNH